MVNYESIYKTSKEKLLKSKNNKELFKEFLDWEEYKLKRINNLSQLDISCFKTLVNCCLYLSNVEKWFKGKDWKNLTKEDIKKVYDDLEDGKIKRVNGKPFMDRASYYNKVFKSKPFKLAGKDEIAREVMEFYKPPEDNGVAFFIEEDLNKMVGVAIKPEHKLLLWLAWDIGENINSLLELQKEDFVRQINKENNEVEYVVNLVKSKIKRSRTQRSELTNFKETTEFLDLILNGKKKIQNPKNKKERELIEVPLKDDDKLFRFGYRQAQEILKRVVRITEVKTRGTIKKSPSWKDFRSSMACHLLDLGWTIDEINSRLGHKPSSSVIDKYVTFKAKKNHKPKRRIFEGDLTKLKGELEESKNREKLMNMRFGEMKNNIQMQEKFNSIIIKNLSKGMNQKDKNVLQELISISSDIK